MYRRDYGPPLASSVSLQSLHPKKTRPVANFLIWTLARFALTAVPVRPAAAPAILLPPGIDRVELAALVGVEHLTHVQKHQRPRLVHRGTHRFDAIDLPRHLRLVRARLDEVRQLAFEMIEVGLVLAQLNDA